MVMSYQVLARKWRPKKFQDVIGQSHVTKSLQNAISHQKIGHAYIFVGTRGVGKTSIARIFAKAIRCENITADGNACNECVACKDFDVDTSMNVIEIDGASNNSVDNIRDLISNIHYLPTSGKYKVYIIDEVHMLSTSAFNALLKTLEEPPAHVVFVLASTEAHKLLGTVLSRCQRFDFRNVQVDELVKHIKDISQAENIKFENERLITELAVLGNGSVRDTLSLLDQVLTFSEGNFISEASFTTSLGVAGPSVIKKIVDSILHGNDKDVQKVFHQLMKENIPLKNFVSSVSDQIFSELQTNKEFSKAELIWVFESLARETVWIFNSISPEKTVEVLLLKLTKRREFFGSAKKNSENVETVIPTKVVATEAVEDTPVELAKEVKIEPVKEIEPVQIPENVVLDQGWDGFLNFLNEKSPASASNLEQGNLTKPIKKTNDSLFIELGFSFSGLVFLDYLKEPEVYQKLLNNLSEYFRIKKENIRIELIEVKEEQDFVSKADIKRMEAEISEQDRIQAFKNNPLLKEAEKIFNSKVDKVILDTNKK